MPKSRPPLEELRKSVAQGPPFPRGFVASLHEDGRAGAQRLYESCLRKQQAIRREQERLKTMMQFEEEALAAGFTCVAGVDEAGRGPLAGPIVAGAVILAGPIEGLNDSKQLTEDQRESLFHRLHDGQHRIGVGIFDASEIDRIGIQQCNYRAMLQAVAALSPPPDFLLVDGFQIPGCRWQHRQIIKGDSLSLSIAAASIVAKVSRDRMMAEFDRTYPGYGFATNKGYATSEHLKAIRRLGPCAVHRKTFAPISQDRQLDMLTTLEDTR